MQNINFHTKLLFIFGIYLNFDNKMNSEYLGFKKKMEYSPCFRHRFSELNENHEYVVFI